VRKKVSGRFSRAALARSKAQLVRKIILTPFSEFDAEAVGEVKQLVAPDDISGAGSSECEQALLG
jgi:hypothetical protein